MSHYEREEDTMNLNSDNATQVRHISDQLYRSLGNYTAGRSHSYDVKHSDLYRWRESLRKLSGLTTPKREPKRKVQVLFNRHALWVGAHYSKYNRRLCINLLPGVTICITQAGGIAP